MNKEYVDELYHQLRLLNIEGDIQEQEAIQGIANHLMSRGGDYTGLLRYLAWYGEEYLLDPVYKAICSRELTYGRVVELGAGLGWLGRGIARLSGDLPTLFADKRHWPLIDIVADIESTNGRQRVLDELKPTDLIVMSELLHCMEEPAESLAPFSPWPMVMIEYHPVSHGKAFAYRESYIKQISKLGCLPVGNIPTTFPRSKCSIFYHFPYMIAIAEPISDTTGE